ncbi:MAG: aminotransferase class III-fold pyridoxal phosphate-dependent enzyme [Nitratireductor sp.]
MTRSFSRSQAMLAEALGVIPLGTQTFSKSTTQYPAGVSPHFVDHARGAVVTDVDGNDYVDFNNALASVTLGHCDPDNQRRSHRTDRQGNNFPSPTRSKSRSPN